MSDTFTLLSYPQRSILIYAEGHSRTQNMPFNTTRKTIYKGVDSTLGFDVKNQDRKPVNLLGKDIMVNIMQVRTGELIVQRRAVTVEPESGFCEFTIFSSDLVDLDPGIYQLSAVVYEADGHAKSLYTDHNRRVTLELELSDGAYPKYLPSVGLTFTQLGSSWISQPILSNLQKNDSSTLHTIQIGITNYTGTVEALVSLEYDSGGNYFPVKFVNDKFQIQFNGLTDIQGWNFIADARWVKIVYTPSNTNTGTVDKILYRS
jgi:hypothetical protein